MPLPVSLFNDVIGPVMRGPSSSHCAAALRIGRLCRDLMDGKIDDILVEFDRNGSLPTTHTSQGSDMGLFGGLLGWEAADDRLPDGARHLAEAGIQIRFETIDSGDPHPNTYRLTLAGNGRRHEVHAISTGGGMMEVIRLDGSPVSFFGDAATTLLWCDAESDWRRWTSRWQEQSLFDELKVHILPQGRLIELRGAVNLTTEQTAPALADQTFRDVRRLGPVLPVTTRKGMSTPFSSAEELVRVDAGRGRELWRHAVDYEMARGQIREAEVVSQMVGIVQILRKSIRQGIAGTVYADRILPPQTPGLQQAISAGQLLSAGALNRILLYVSALMEVKSSMGVIVAAPTAGACAALPAAVIGMASEMDLDEEAMARAMLAAGMVGVIIATRWTFAAEVGGCQAEGGAAASMAAAALVTLAGGTLKQSLNAASMALQSMIGLICDPVASRVEIPCLGKNVMAAANALSCANLALANFDAVIPLDEVIDTAKRVADQMPRELRCTSLGGLATTPTALRLFDQLNSRCGTTCGCS